MAFEQGFNAVSLPGLRKTVLAVATRVGMSGSRAVDVMVAVHELAANAVRHGGGAGVVRLSAARGKLCCQVSDAGAGAAGQADSDAEQPWPLMPGHGLWLADKVADCVHVARGRGGSKVTAVFAVFAVACSCQAAGRRLSVR